MRILIKLQAPLAQWFNRFILLFRKNLFIPRVQIQVDRYETNQQCFLFSSPIKFYFQMNWVIIIKSEKDTHIQEFKEESSLSSALTQHHSSPLCYVKQKHFYFQMPPEDKYSLFCDHMCILLIKHKISVGYMVLVL